jgi:hypothetical protein
VASRLKRIRERALSAATAAVVLAVVVVVVGAGAYVAFGHLSPSPTVVTSCRPAGSPACLAALGNAHDLKLLVPIRSTQQGSPIPFTVLMPSGESSSAITFNFGDGSKPVTTSATAADHVYAQPGTYLVSVTALIGGVLHDNDRALAQVTITPSYATNSLGNLPQVSGRIVSNSSSSTVPTAVLTVGESVTVAGSYAVAPTNPAWVATPPSLSAPGGVVQTTTPTGSGVSARVLYNTPGEYTITFAGGAKGPGGATAPADYLWSVFVASASVHPGVTGASRPVSPHPGTVVAYELAPGGGSSEDPAIDYDISGDEVILNVYETLIFYNGTATGPAPQDFIPELATCVPGSAACAHLYGGNSLVQGWNFTFVISPNANFYDPYTGKSWPVYPSDVVFSVARTMGFSDLPCQGCNNGWILTQALLPSGSSTWDGGIHSPYNNTPQSVFGSMSVNDSRWCPSAALTNAHGCVTFHVDGLAQPWPQFLELIADGQGGSIVPCAWFSSTASTGGGTGIPGWTLGNVTDAGDHPCRLPGGATTTNSSAFRNAVAAMPPTSWDTWENDCSGAATSTYCGTVQYRMAGSGPYYLSGYQVGAAYSLKANPAYRQNPYCTTVPCLPGPGAYPANVQVTWESSQLPGEQALAAGIADYASIPSTDFALLLQYAEQGKVNVLSIPSIDINVQALAFNFSASAALKYTSNPINVPNDWFSYLGVREFYVHAYPYATIQSTVNTKDGIQTGFNFGGAIPQFMANYYPTNISWPSGDPCSDASNPQCPGYWWQQLRTPGSPYYDPEVVKCSSASPCQLPLFGPTGAPDMDQRLALWSNELSAFSGGALRAAPVDVSPIDIYNAGSDPPGTTPFANSASLWAPDYPDPPDYIVPFYYPDNTFTYSSGIAEQVGLPAFNASGCHSATDYVYWSKSANPLPSNCQGAAYWAMITAFNAASPMPNGPARALIFNLGEQIANRLALYVYMFQTDVIVPLAPWWDPGSYSASVLTGGGGISDWFYLTSV